MCDYMYVYLIDLSPLGLARVNETNYWNKLKRLRISTGRRQTSCLYASEAEELNLVLESPRTFWAQELFGPEKQVVKLESAWFEKLIF